MIPTTCVFRLTCRAVGVVPIVGVTTSHVGSVGAAKSVVVKKRVELGTEEAILTVCGPGRPAKPVVVCQENDSEELLMVICGGAVTSKCTGMVNGFPLDGVTVILPSKPPETRPVGLTPTLIVLAENVFPVEVEALSQPEEVAATL